MKINEEIKWTEIAIRLVMPFSLVKCIFRVVHTTHIAFRLLSIESHSFTRYQSYTRYSQSAWKFIAFAFCVWTKSWAAAHTHITSLDETREIKRCVYFSNEKKAVNEQLKSAIHFRDHARKMVVQSTLFEGKRDNTQSTLWLWWCGHKHKHTWQQMPTNGHTIWRSE